ncbi:hypothetical protein T12_16372 [Trichinella patagoniensis]|uniref:Uncharacterized protein n=1 Tax=Trichinella patagoniensis TaxID=990121 RepID=A0A0V0YQ23_9BILA|nr:hypothetical protein T12_16372 [Trichinella patagoniensis]
MLMPSAFLPFFLPPDYSYNQFLSQAGRPAEAQLGKSERTNLAISESQTNYARSTSMPSSSALEWST